MGPLIITYTILVVPYYNSSRMGPKTLFLLLRPYINVVGTTLFGVFIGVYLGVSGMFTALKELISGFGAGGCYWRGLRVSCIICGIVGLVSRVCLFDRDRFGP